MLMRKILVGAIMIIFLVGCQSIYSYKGAQYTSSEAALRAQRDDINQMIAEIKPTNNPLGGRALIVLPSKRLIENKGIRIRGHSTREMWEYLISGVEAQNASIVEALKRRKIFEDVLVEKSDTPETATSPDRDVVIYFKLVSPNEFQWFLRVTSGQSIPIYEDKSLPFGSSQRMLSWLDYLEKTAAEQLGRQKSEGK